MIDQSRRIRRRVTLLRAGFAWLLATAVVVGLDVHLVNAAEPGQANGPSGGDGVIGFFQRALDTSGFQPRWQGGDWNVEHSWLRIAADLTIWVTSLLIPIVLIYFVRRRSALPFVSRFWIFGAYIFACGLIQLLDALMFWWPAYRLTSIVSAGTALISLITVAVLVPLVPKALALRSPAELQREIAQRRRTELELRQVHAQLEGVIEQRTSELAAKNEEMEQFLNTVSHDLKSPVVTCLGLTGMLREDLQAGRIEETQDSVNRIERSVTRMRQLIDDLLNLSRIGRVRFELTEVDTLEMIRSIGDELRPRLEPIGASLEIEDTLPRVMADSRWLSEVFENLLTNAIKYGCDNPRPRIVVGSIAQDGENRIFVRDNGKGIDSAHHAQIFEPFRRLPSDKEGSGMGLAIVVRIIKMHAGRVWIESEPGKGATFWVALPALAPAETSQALEPVHA
jgi:two-component system, chemotaxis family, sensor kinase Cph1